MFLTGENKQYKDINLLQLINKCVQFQLKYQWDILELDNCEVCLKG